MKNLVTLLNRHRTKAGIFLIWLFHLSGLVGILLGGAEWFIPKTPLNLILCAGLFLWVFPVNTLKKSCLFALIVVCGIGAEWIGVHTGYLFGSYSYGENLGPKLDGVPYLIGINWALLSMASGSVSQYWKLSMAWQVLIGGLLMVSLDFFLEQLAPALGYWTFVGGHPPLWNYICWLVLALLFQGCYHALKIRGNQEFSLHLLGAQFVFFISLALYYPGLP
ncbi:carotenoid biosynthesis protein [Robiginitalea sediminis]|uniref:carotenoid biosynthesis protein n=1 Tax=Robiginitalea sediminis TaxID=1982593 RepID=UPI000B4BAA57|nr:carotenoid biosynthesis protein [Robiginitalea sediminis]